MFLRRNYFSRSEIGQNQRRFCQRCFIVIPLKYRPRTESYFWLSLAVLCYKRPHRFLPVTHSRRLVLAEFTGGSLLGEFLCYFAPPGYNCRRIYATTCHNDTLSLLANISLSQFRGYTVWDVQRQLLSISLFHTPSLQGSIVHPKTNQLLGKLKDQQ